MNLFEIEQKLFETINKAVDEDGCIIDDKAFAAFEALEIERDKKIEGIACWVKNLVADAEAERAEARAFAERAQRDEKMVESLKRLIARFMPGEKYKGVRAEISFRKSQAVEVKVPAELLPSVYTRIKVEADKTALKEALKAGEKINGAELVNRTSVIIRRLK